jgi:hypothetical protein
MQQKPAMGGRCTLNKCSNCKKESASPCIVDTTDLESLTKSAYKKLILTHHPDKKDNNDSSMFRKVFEAFKTIQPFIRSSARISSVLFHNHEEEFKLFGLECTCGQSVTPVNNPKCTYTEKYIFFDYESQQSTGVHIPNLVVAHDFEGNKWEFNTNDEFCSWLISPEHRGYTAIAHYSQGYDSQFIMQYCVQNTLKPETIYNGTKLMYLKIHRIGLRIIDSFNFVSSPLASFPKTFGLTELKKGYFPHLFNTVENEQYVGPIPDKKYYGYNTMKAEARKAFLEWYSEKVAENYIFDLRKELKAYCHSDVDILRRSCIELRKEFLEIENVDPFQYITLPSVCMAIFRSSHLKSNNSRYL